METSILVLVLSLIASVCVIRYQIKRERYLIELNNSNEMESSKTMLEMKEEISSLTQRLHNACEIGNRHLRLSHERKREIAKLAQQRNGYKGKVVQLVNERKVLRNELEITHGLLRDALDKLNESKVVVKHIEEVADNDEWPEIDITKVLVKPETKLTYDGYRYKSTSTPYECRSCAFHKNYYCSKIKCGGIIFTKPE